METKNAETLDLVWGVRAIANLIGRTERQAFDMCSAGHLPARQVGKRWVVSRREIERFFAVEAG